MVSIVSTHPAAFKYSSINPQEKIMGFSTIPISWYVDSNFYTQEQHYMVDMPKYVGHSLMVPNIGDYFTLTSTFEEKMLLHSHDGIKLSSNICKHRQAIMLNGKGNAQHIVCPLHRWTYQLNGQLLGAPKFEETPCLQLEQSHLQVWNGLLFESQRNVVKELSQIKCADYFDFSGFKYSNMVIEDYDFNWKTFIEVYLEDYHVSSFHPGLNQFVDCSDLNWEFGEHFSAQIVGIQPNLVKSGSVIYQAWQTALMNYSEKKVPKFGAIWLVFYPNLMIEWYPHVLVVSHLMPQGPNECRNFVEFYYPEDIILFEPDFIKAHQAAYFETAAEDKEICQRMHNGRKALYANSKDERGPYQHPLETGLEHFHQWLNSQWHQSEQPENKAKVVIVE